MKPRRLHHEYAEPRKVGHVWSYATSAPARLWRRGSRVKSARTASFDGDAVVAASHASTQQHVLAGLLHDLNGPLNNLGLTLALLERALEPLLAERAGTDANVRVRRYLSTLTQEAARLTTWSRAAATTVHPPGMTEPALLREVLDDVHRSLRHHATLAETRLVVDASRAADVGVSDGAAARAALRSFVVGGVGVAHSAGTVSMAGDVRGETAVVRMVVEPVRDLALIARAFASVAVSPASPVEAHFLAGRLQAEALHGSASMRAESARVDIEMVLPRA